jgi:hypothetical protein
MYMQEPTPTAKPYLQMLIGGLLLSLVFATIFVGGFELVHLGRIYPGVSIGGVSVGGKTLQDAASLLTREITYPYNGKIILQDGSNRWAVSP